MTDPPTSHLSGPPVKGEPVMLSSSLSSPRAPAPVISQSVSGRQMRRPSNGSRAPTTSPTVIPSNSFSRSSRLSTGSRSATVTPQSDRLPTSMDARKRTSTEPGSASPTASKRLAPSNLTMTRPASSTGVEAGPQARSRSPFGLPDSFRPAKHVYDQSSIRPRPWKAESRSKRDIPTIALDASYCSNNSVPPEQMDAYDSTEVSVKEAIKAITMVSIEVVVKILDSGVLAYVPIPGLEAIGQILVSTWNIVRTVSNNRLRLLRLTQRCAHLLLSVKQDVQDAGDRVHAALQRALDCLVAAFTKVRVLAETQKEAPFLKRLIARGEMEEQFSACDEELNNALKLFSLSVQINTMKLVAETTESLRKQNEELASQNQQLLQLCSPRPQSQPIPGLVEQTLSACSSGSPQYTSLGDRTAVAMSMSDSANGLGSDMRRSRSTTTARPVVHRATASSRGKQVHARRLSPEPRAGMHIPQTGRTPPSSGLRRPASKDVSPSRRGQPDSSGVIDWAEDPMAKIVHHQRVQNEFDRRCDMQDLKQLIKETLEEGKDSFIIKLLQIDVKDFPQAILVLQNELQEYQSGEAKASSSLDDKDIHQRFIQRGVDAMKRMTQSEDLESPEWTINKFKILELETIGYGAFSTVRRGLWNNQVVAIKILSPKTKPTVFENEMRIWKGLSHPNILPLLGASNSTEEPLFFVSLYSKHGNLVDFLHALRQHDLEGVFGGMLKELNASAEPTKKRYSRRNSNSLMREQAHHNRWYGSGSPSTVDAERFYTLPLSKSDSKFNRCHVLKDGDIFRFMLDIARGMEYLHEKGVLHGDLKASNILVNDDLTCVISDFGQSERRTDIYRASGWTPKGTARWKAPELLNGAEGDLTTAVDVYAFAITCIEIMSMGGVPWGSMEDSILCHRIVVENFRPSIPSDFKDSGLEPLFNNWWNKDPNVRPEFKDIVASVQSLIDEVEEGALEDVRRKSQRLSLSPQLHSPEFPPVTEHVAMSFEQSPVISPASPSLSGSNQDVGKAYFPVWVSSSFSDLHLSPSSLEDQFANSASATAMPTPMLPSTSVNRTSRVGWESIESPRYSEAQQLEPSVLSSAMVTSSNPVPCPILDAAGVADVHPITHGSEDESEPSFVKVDYESSETSLPSVLAMELTHEELYRRVQHEFHWSLRIPLWNPAPIQVGDVGYMSPDTRTFVTLFNAFKPFHAPYDSSISIPSILGFGDPMPKHSKITTIKSRKLFRTFSYKVEVQEGHPMAHCFCESPDWHYLEETKPAQEWFKAAVNPILKIHGEEHGFLREELCLVVGTLQASRYSLFVSCNHPTGSVEFTVHSGKKGRAWGSFSIGIPESRGRSSSADLIMASRISEVSGAPNALFLSAMRFPPEASVPILV